MAETGQDRDAGAPGAMRTEALLRRRLRAALVVALLPIMLAVGGLLVYHHLHSGYVRYIIAFSKLGGSLTRLQAELVDLHAADLSDRTRAREAFADALGHYWALRAVDEDGREIEAEDAEAKPELRRLAELFAVDPHHVSREPDLTQIEMPAVLESIWGQAGDWSVDDMRQTPLEVIVGTMLVTVVPCVERSGRIDAGEVAVIERSSQMLQVMTGERMHEVATLLHCEVEHSEQAPLALALIVIGAAFGGTAFARFTMIAPLRRELVIVERKLTDEAVRALAAERAKSEFLASMSHEIRTPMNGVIGMVELLAGTRLDERQRMFADVIVSSAQSILGIISDILDVSRIDAGHLVLDPRSFRLSDLVGAPARLLARSAQEKGPELAVRIQPDLPHGVRATSPGSAGSS